jgi:hypothetical protein
MLFAMRSRHFLLIILCGVFFAALTFSPAPLYAGQAPLMEVGITLQEDFLRISIPNGYNLIELGSGTPIDKPAGDYRFSL